MDHDIQKIQDDIKQHLGHNAPLLAQAVIDIEAMIDASVQEYDDAVESIKQEIINDPNEVTDPEQEMLTRIAKRQEEIHAELKSKLGEYQQEILQKI